MLARLDETVWFRAVGQPVDDAVVAVRSWKEAIARCASPGREWEGVTLEARGEMTAFLSERAPARDEAWNERVDEVKTVLVPMIERKIADVVRANDLPKAFEEDVGWNLLGVAMAAEYSDLYQSVFYGSLADWYLRGRFPCGWEGKWPAGKLVVY